MHVVICSLSDTYHMFSFFTPVCLQTSPVWFQARQECRISRGEQTPLVPAGGRQLAPVQLVHSSELHPGRRDGPGKDSAVHRPPAGGLCKLGYT